jgi:hypothetical protein
MNPEPFAIRAASGRFALGTEPDAALDPAPTVGSPNAPAQPLAMQKIEGPKPFSRFALTFLTAGRSLVGKPSTALQVLLSARRGEMKQMGPFHRRLGRLVKLASLAAALSLLAAPLAFATSEAGSENTPEGVPPGYTGEENPGAEYTPNGVPTEEVPPEGVPLGPPEETPPAGVPVGSEGSAPPEGVTLGPPAGVQPGGPEGVAPASNGNENRGSVHHLTGHEARALGREECQEWKSNFRDNKSQFGRCIADVARALHGSAAPGQACSNMSRKPDENEHRSDFSACVSAAAQALREQHAG